MTVTCARCGRSLKSLFDYLLCAGLRRDEEAMYRAKAKRLHADVGGDDGAMAELNKAIEKIRAERHG